ncbi:MAG: hypothetical protein [Caudoviricetes sp.]|nr:MAG: hypothetical protein [Caudoviricetes sp.]
MTNKFIHYLEANDLEIYDVAKLLRDSEWNQSGKYRTRQSFVRLLEHMLYYPDWQKLDSHKGWKVEGLYNYYDGAITAWRIADILGCKKEDIV